MKFYDLLDDIKYLKKISQNKISKNIWEQRSLKFLDYMIKNNGEINHYFFRNFRSHKNKLIAENPSKLLNNFFLKIIYSHQRKYIYYLYKKLTKSNKKLKYYMNFFKLDKIGNPGFSIIDNLKLNERFIRHCHFFSLFEKFFSKKNIDNVVDIGGGYGSFTRMIHKRHPKIKLFIVDLPEQLLTAKFYLKNNFPKSKISKLEDVYKVNKIDKIFASKYNIILIPHTVYEKININFKRNLIINFNSFGEIDNKSFNKYFNSKLLKKSKYLFSVNRIDSFPTYSNNITFLDFNFENYKNIYSNISAVWDIYFIKKFYLFTKKKYFSSRILEFIGKK